MDQADFVHMVRMSEHASEHDSRAYRRSVAAFAALGYVWILGCMLLAAAALWWVVPQLLHGRFRWAMAWMLPAAGGLLWTCARALWVRIDLPEGIEITAEQAPALFDALERIRKKIKGPVIHHVYVDGEFNASIRQVPRYGLFGGAVNQLTIGLPLAMALDKPRLLAVLAHEYGHLRGDHGRFAAWVYRTRLSWQRLHEKMGEDAGPVAVATQTFLNWYFPRFAAKTFALARQDEYEADRISARLLGAGVAAAALTEIEVKGAWLGDMFWAQHWNAASTHPLPVGPYAAMRSLLALPPEPAFAQKALRQALQRISSVDDTHPVLRDRIEALTGDRAALPAWSQRGALSLLGPHVPQWLTHFDQRWCRENATAWKRQHAWLARVREQAEALQQTIARHNAQETVELAALLRQLDPGAAVRALYEQALQRSEDHAGALQGLVECLPEEAWTERLHHLERLWQVAPAHRWWAACTAVEELESVRPGRDHDAEGLKRWRERLRLADAAEKRAWEELTAPPYFSRVRRHDLAPFELGEVQAELARYEGIARCWLVCKQLQEFAQRRAYIVFVELPDMDDGQRYALCRRLERQLSLPGPALVLWAGEAPTLAEIRRSAFEPVFASPRGA